VFVLSLFNGRDIAVGESSTSVGLCGGCVLGDIALGESSTIVSLCAFVQLEVHQSGLEGR